MPFINVNWQSFNSSKSHCTPLTLSHFNDVKKIKITNWSGLPFPSPGDLPNPGIKPRSTCIAGRFFTNWAIREALLLLVPWFKCRQGKEIAHCSVLGQIPIRKHCYLKQISSFTFVIWQRTILSTFLLGRCKE